MKRMTPELDRRLYWMLEDRVMVGDRKVQYPVDCKHEKTFPRKLDGYGGYIRQCLACGEELDETFVPESESSGRVLRFMKR